MVPDLDLCICIPGYPGYLPGTRVPGVDLRCTTTSTTRFENTHDAYPGVPGYTCTRRREPTVALVALQNLLPAAA
eukprot:3811462-Rhodomonas_salina.1